MPPRRRAQGPPSSPPPLPPTTRRREPSASPPRLSLQTRPPYAPPELLPEGTKRRRKLSARAKADEDLERNKDTVPGRTPGRSTPKQRKEWDDYLQRQAAAAQRARDRKQREEDEWEAEKTQYGEAEALRHRRVELEARRVSEMASTSEIDEMEYEDRIADPELDITASLRVNKRLEWSSSFGTQHLKNFTISSIEEAMIKAIDQRDGFNKGWNITKYTAIVRNSKRPRRIQSFDVRILSRCGFEKLMAGLVGRRHPCANIFPYAAADIVDEVTYTTSKFIWKCGTPSL